MDLNLALAIVAAESVDGSAERGEQPYFWPMAELVGFFISECQGSDDPAVAAIIAQPDLARERAAEIDAAVAASRARAAARLEEWNRERS